MKNLLAILAFFIITSACISQNVTLTVTNPRNQIPTAWSQGQSWIGFYPFYDDLVSLNNNSASLSGANTFVGTATFNGSVYQKATIISDSALTKVTLTAAQTGSTILMKALAGDTIALPSSVGTTIGTHFVVLFAYSSTSVGHCIETNGTDVLYGTAFVSSTTTPYTNPYLSTTNKIMLCTPTTTGGLAGGRLEFTALGGNKWNVSALLYGSSTPATPFK